MELWAKNCGSEADKWLRYKVCFGLGESGIEDGWWLVECEIEVLYQILAWGIVEKMKNNPRQAMPAKVQKAGLHTCALFVKSCPAWAIHVARRLFVYALCTIVQSCIIHSVIVRFIVLLFWYGCTTLYCHILYGI